MSALPWPAPAKLNLFLHVTGRRPDGYHRLQTLFQFIDLCDGLDFQVTAGGAVRRLTAVPGVPEDEDLTVRAARALQRLSGTRQGVDIRVDKRLPMAAGLGGGSSDAATTLMALNHLWGLGLSTRDLITVGLGLGADVPVFVHGHAAWAEGVGEEFTPVDVVQPWYVVLTPSCPVATKDVFAAPELTRDCPPITISDFLSGRGVNVCEPVVRRRYPEVAAALDDLAAYAPARLSGTGGSVFAAFPNREGAAAALGRLSSRWRAWVVRGINRSPLLDVLERMRAAVRAG